MTRLGDASVVEEVWTVRRREGNRAVLKHEQHLVNGNFRNSFFTVPSGIELRISLEVEVVLMVFGLTVFVGKTPHASEVSREFSTKSIIPLDMKKIKRLWQHSVFTLQ